MNIVELLNRDHEMIIRELTEIKRSIGKNDLRGKIKLLAKHLAAHEHVEEEILFSRLKLNKLISVEVHPDWLTESEKAHNRIWISMGRLLEVTESRQLSLIQQGFFDFCSMMEAHMRDEERVLFPIILRSVESHRLEELGSEAESCFAERCVSFDAR